MLLIVIAILVVGFFIVRAIGAPERERKKRELEEEARIFRDTNGGGQF